MFSPPLDLTDARILVVNDDGIRAPGLKVLESIAKSFTKDIWVFAPEEEQSGAGHSLSLSKAVRVTKLAQKRYAVGGVISRRSFNYPISGYLTRGHQTTSAAKIGLYNFGNT